jgi:protein O-GlcNAcase/histone acetyltransferase
MLHAGAIEGFYGPPWTQAQRLELFDWMSAWGLDTYLYCPKDDLHHRALWREPYPAADATMLARVVEACADRRVRFVYGLGPGLDIRYSDENDMEHLRARCAQMLALGCRHFALLFDDIPDRIDAVDLSHWGSLAAAQCHVANTLLAWLRTRDTATTLAFCPTPYCGRMAAAQLGGAGYLDTVGQRLAPEIDVFWTGPEIVSREISVAHVRDLRSVLRRPPILWDNLHANDYDGRRFMCGPYAGRPVGLRGEVRGILSNPNTEFPLNYVPLRTLAGYTRTEGPWDARAAYLAAVREWWPRFETVHGVLDLDTLVLLCDCYYLPYEEGAGADALLSRARRALGERTSSWRDDAEAFVADATRLRDFCGRLATLRDRPLFHALGRRVWDLREELDLLVRCVDARLHAADGEPPLRSDFHLPGTYRGGMTERLQRLLVQHADGTFTSAPPPSEPAP